MLILQYLRMRGDQFYVQWHFLPQTKPSDPASWPSLALYQGALDPGSSDTSMGIRSRYVLVFPLRIQR